MQNMSEQASMNFICDVFAGQIYEAQRQQLHQLHQTHVVEMDVEFYATPICGYVSTSYIARQHSL